MVFTEVYKPEEKRDTFHGCAIEGGKIFVQTFDGYLMTINPDTGESSIIEKIENERLIQGHIVQYIQNLDGKLFLFDMNFRDIVSYDIAQKRCKQIIKFDRQGFGGNQYVFIANNKRAIYAFPRSMNKVIKISDHIGYVQNRTYTDFDKSDAYGCMGEGKVYIFSKKTGSGIVFDTKSEQFSKQFILQGIIGCIDAYYFNREIYFLHPTGACMRWNLKSEKCETVQPRRIFEEDYFSKIVVSEKNSLLLPGLGNTIYILEKDEKIKPYDAYPIDLHFREEEKPGKRGFVFFESCEDDGFLYFSARILNYVLRIDKKDGEISWIGPFAPAIEGRIRERLKNYRFVHEREDYLETFIKMDFEKKQKGKGEVIGKEIFRLLKEI